MDAAQWMWLYASPVLTKGVGLFFFSFNLIQCFAKFYPNIFPTFIQKYFLPCFFKSDCSHHTTFYMKKVISTFPLGLLTISFLLECHRIFSFWKLYRNVIAQNVTKYPYIRNRAALENCSRDFEEQ